MSSKRNHATRSRKTYKVRMYWAVKFRRRHEKPSLYIMQPMP